MVKIVFLTSGDAGDRRLEIEAKLGESVMQAAVRNAVPGVIGECGGSCTCATCHVKVDPAWFEKVGPPPDFENEMLIIADDRSDTSRLSCQIDVTEELEGMVVTVSTEQHA